MILRAQIFGPFFASVFISDCPYFGRRIHIGSVGYVMIKLKFEVDRPTSAPRPNRPLWVARTLGWCRTICCRWQIGSPVGCINVLGWNPSRTGTMKTGRNLCYGMTRHEDPHPRVAGSVTTRHTRSFWDRVPVFANAACSCVFTVVLFRPSWPAYSSIVSP